MALDSSDRRFLRQIYGNLTDKPLQPGSAFYEPVYKILGLDDPVQQISTLIDFDGVQSIRLFSGFRGSGKTTELLRLKCELEGQGYFVLYADALTYVNAAEPIDITDLLMVLAGAFSDALEECLGADNSRETYWDRLWAFLHREVTLKDAGVKLEYQTPLKEILGGLKGGLDLKFELKSATTFRENLRPVLINKLKELKTSVDRFFEDGIRLIRAAQGEDTRVVFIFDQLEQLQGTLQSEQDVIRSVERIFATHLDLLKIPRIHSVFTVPPWLKFVLPNTVPITLLCTVHLWENDEARSHNEPAWAVFRSLIERRIGKEGLERLFGPQPGQQDLIDRTIAVCGGHFRDLLRLLRDVTARAAAANLPVAPSLVIEAINAARRDFLPIARDDAKWLADIARVRATALPSTEAAPVNRLARFLNSHFVLYFVNGKEWYDIHPLIREEVMDVVQAAASAAED
ncbi:hypothetical protein CCS01_15575 [Rhodopila globiformis]|uniref:Orc1-like AAA ATPase domain-containing protein n=2 Tax=Rhodopila globiformis TaxID=1071 RepID=A0A2S6NDD2_RHOGL|nr:hypothetical protein CCS01_15575 [Rhodopila globiformis]